MEFNSAPKNCLMNDIKPRRDPNCLIYQCPPRPVVEDDIHAKELIYPAPLTRFHQFLLDSSECIYESRKHPLEMTTRFPKYAPCIDQLNTTFGVNTIRKDTDLTVKDLINPSIPADKVACDSLQGHDLYVKTHKSYNPGELATRCYRYPSFNPCDKFGQATFSDNTGKATRKLLHYELYDCPSTEFVSCRYNNFQERYKYPLGQHRTSLKGILCIPTTTSFGVASNYDEHELGDLLHWREECNLQNFKHRMRAHTSKIRNHIKRVNMYNFDSARQAFCFFDKDNKGFIDAEALRVACSQFNLILNDEELYELMKDSTCSDGRCDLLQLDDDGEDGATTNAGDGEVKHAVKEKISHEFQDIHKIVCTEEEKKRRRRMKMCELLSTMKISFEEFANFLTFFRHMPIEQPGAQDIPRYIRQIDRIVTDMSRTSQEVNSVVGGMDSKKLMAFGKSTEPWLALKGRYDEGSREFLYEFKNADQIDSLISPSTFTSVGITDEDLMRSRSKEEIREIFHADVCRLLDVDFDGLFNEACSNYKQCVSVRNFRRTVEEALNSGRVKFIN